MIVTGSLGCNVLEVSPSASNHTYYKLPIRGSSSSIPLFLKTDRKVRRPIEIASCLFNGSNSIVKLADMSGYFPKIPSVRNSCNLAENVGPEIRIHKFKISCQHLSAKD